MEDIRFCPEHGYYRGERCDRCNHKGELILDKVKVEKLGRFISGILRHFPDRFGLEMDENGWVDFEKLSKVVSRKYRWANKWLIKAIVYSDKKGRYELSDGKIRARYGHSVDVKLNDYEEAENDVLYYGTSEEEAHRLLEIGIKPVNQKFVHLSTTIDKGIEVALLRTDEPIILMVDAKKARTAGIKFLKANNHIVLSEEIPPEFIKIIEIEKEE
ncbi:RNA:NAD 2-phosphotransferase [Archaeoglobus sulfaticallidus PM70-1]|uniref:Probable RNA 2'-phosphotransferase n=1 Tax=Archaeoglobus sulfaticallidus PM70-1 TaxID=387631 RepID=N0BCZ2_9EURY|nr:RNA 2'-phosphotransferase [Archaeoglobus sulfaticallidus]AGK60883.1 RNA:NAD 2-phosphotransferase [Archaeoglobus sulfaticallidus PM70-1]